MGNFAANLAINNSALNTNCCLFEQSMFEMLSAFVSPPSSLATLAPDLGTSAHKQQAAIAGAVDSEACPLDVKPIKIWLDFIAKFVLT